MFELGEKENIASADEAICVLLWNDFYDIRLICIILEWENLRIIEMTENQ